MELFKSVITYLVDSFKLFFSSWFGEPFLYLFLIAAVFLFLYKVFKR